MGGYRYHSLLLGLIFFSAAALLVGGAWYCYTSTFDTATVGLMAVNILNGDRPLFYYGQPYFGALEAYLSAFFLAVFGFSEWVVALSPISFTLLWILFTYLLFTRIYNRTAGIVAAACAAFPGYYIFWYSIATYGGYPVILCLGSAVIWLALRIVQNDPDRIGLFTQCASLGILAALAIWVHALTLPYLAVAAVILVFFLLKKRFRPDIILSILVTVVIGMFGFLPFYIETGSFMGGISARVPLNRDIVINALTTLFCVDIRELVLWNFLKYFHTAAIRRMIMYSSVALAFAAPLFALLSLVTGPRRLAKKILFLIPLAFCLLFLLLFVQHHLATLKAPRYAIAFWVMTLSLFWSLAIAGQGISFIKRIAVSFFCLWILIQIIGTLSFILRSHGGARREQQIIREVVDAAKKEGLRSVEVLYGDHLLRYKAEKFSMFSGNNIVFVYSEFARCQVNAQLVELDENRGYLTDIQSRGALQNTLLNLGTEFKITTIDKYVLFSHIRAPRQYNMHAVPVAELNLVSEDGVDLSQLIDGDQDTGISGGGDRFSVHIDSRVSRTLCGLWLFSKYDPSRSKRRQLDRFDVYVSDDNSSFTRVFSSLPGGGNGFYAGNHIFLGGAWLKMETSFPPRPARYVRIVFYNLQPSSVSELILLTGGGSMRPDDAADITEIKKIIIERDIQFVYGDRWLSANLLEQFKGTSREKIALARRSNGFTNRPLHYFIRPRKGMAMVCDSAVADLCEEQLVKEYGKKVVVDRVDMAAYTFFALGDVFRGMELSTEHYSALLWNGHIPLRTTDMDLISPWLHFQGYPVWQSGFVETGGLYHDSWTNGRGVFKGIDYEIRPGIDNRLVVFVNGWRPEKDRDRLNLRIVVNDTVTLSFAGQSENSYWFTLPPSLKKIESIEVLSTTFIPPGPDLRHLGIDIKRIELQH